MSASAILSNYNTSHSMCALARTLIPGVYGNAWQTQTDDGITAFLPDAVQEELSKINNDPVKLTLALNAVVVFLFAAFAAYKLATVDLDISRGWTWYEVLLR